MPQSEQQMPLAWAEYLMMILGLWKTKNMMTVTVRTMDRLQSLFCCCSRLRAASDPEVVSCSINYCTLFFALSPFWKKVIFKGWLKKLNFCWLNFEGCQLWLQFFSVIPYSILKIHEVILTPTFSDLDEFEESCDQKSEKQEIRKTAILSKSWNLAIFHFYT